MIVWQVNDVNHALTLVNEAFDHILFAEVFQTFLKIMKIGAKNGIILKNHGQILKS